MRQMTQTAAERLMAEWMGQAGIPLLDVHQRDGGELRVVHQLPGSTGIEDSQDHIQRVAALFTGVYPRTDARILVGFVADGDGEEALIYYCEEEWAADAAESHPDPGAITESAGDACGGGVGGGCAPRRRPRNSVDGDVRGGYAVSSQRCFDVFPPC